MQQIRFLREGLHHYMVCRSEGEYVDNYENRLLQYQEIPFLLSYEIRNIDGKCTFYYRLKYHTPLKKVMGDIKITSEILNNMIFSIISVIETLEDYLLEFNAVVWKSEMIFIEPDTGRLYFCYNSQSKEGNGTIKELLTEWMQVIGKKDEKTVLLLLKFYHLITEQNCSFEELMKFRKEHIHVIDHNSGIETNEKMTAEEDAYLVCQQETEVKEKMDYFTKEKEEASVLAEQVIKISLIAVALINLILLLCLLCNILTYDYMRYLFLSMGVLILFTILYMKVTKEQDADEIMQAYFENEQRKECETQKTPVKEKATYGETSVLMEEICESGMSDIVKEDVPQSLCLLPYQRGRYEELRMNKDSVVIGCLEEGCDYLLQEKGISRMHAKLMQKADGLFILDLNSTNGTYRNGERMESGEEYLLEEGDVVAFAQVQFSVVAQDIASSVEKCII